MVGLPRTYFDAPASAASSPMAGWSEERKRFFMQNGYDRGPDPVQQGGILMGEGNILQRKRGPETTVRVTETPPDDPTPTKRVTTTKYPEDYPAQAGGALAPSVSPQFEQPGMQGDPYAGLLTQPREAPTFESADPNMWGGGNPLAVGMMGADPTWSPDTAINRPPLIGGTGIQYEGGDETDNIMNAIMMAESGGDPNAVKSDDIEDSVGLFQVNWDVWGKGGEYEYLNKRLQSILGRDLTREDLFDPDINRAVADAIRDKQGLGAWSAYNNGSYEQFLTDQVAAPPEEAAPVEATDPRFARWLPGEVGGMVDPNQLPAGAAGRNRPPEYFDWLEEQKRQQSRAFGDVGLLGQQAAAPVEAAPDPLDFWQQKGFAETGVSPDDINLREQLQEQGLYEDDVAGSYDPGPKPGRFGLLEPFIPTSDEPQYSREVLELAMEGKDPSGNTVLYTAPDGTTVTMDDIVTELGLTAAGFMGGGVGAVTRIPSLIKRFGGLSNFVARNWRNIQRIATRKMKGKKPKGEKPPAGKTKVEQELDDEIAKVAAATAAKKGGAQTTAEAANATALAGRFAPIRTGVKTGLKVATPVAAVGLLDEGSEEERAAGEWPGLVELEGMPWWLKRAYDASRSGLEKAGEFVTGRGGALVEGLSATEEERAEKQAQEGWYKGAEAGYQYSPTGPERGRGLLSAAKSADTTPTDIGQDWDAETGGMLEGEDDESGMEAWYKSNEAKRKAIEDVARQDAEAKQADLDRYYANFPEDVEGKRERYLKALNQIYKKVAILNVIAALTNSPSQAGAFMQLAAEKFKTLEGFRGEERLQKIARGVFFNEDGVFDAPKDKQDAFNRAMRFGANHDEALALSGHQKEYAPKATETGVRIWSNSETGQQIWLPKDQAPSGEGWLPTKLDKAGAGTEYERQRANAIELLNAGNEEAAIADLENWFISKNTMMQLMPEQATIIVKYIIDNLKKGIILSDEEIRSQARVGGADVPHLGDF